VAGKPVIIGTGQLVDREADVDRHIEPLDMLIEVARSAAEEAGIGDRGLASLDTVSLVETAGWHPGNAPNLLASALGASARNEYVTGTGGQVGISLFNKVSADIAAGHARFALVAGCNNLKVLMKAIGQGRQLDWSRGGDGSATMIGGNEPGSNELEGLYGLKQPPDIYPLFENALRAKLGLDIDAHYQRMGNLFTNFTKVAAANPYAWFPTERSADELITATPTNRMISFPYPKYLNAVLNTEQAAALLVCDEEMALEMGVPREKWVYWLGGAQAQEEAWWASERPAFTLCPSMKDSHLSALHNAGKQLDDVQHFDFYSCFPIAVEMACEMLGLDINDPRGFTVTGGLPYAGGPASAYTLHSLAEMARCLQAHPGETGMVTGNGWYLTKHSAAILSSGPPEKEPVEGLLDNLPSNEMEVSPHTVDPEATGAGQVETYTVSYDRDGQPTRGIVVGSLHNGTRFLANTPTEVSFLEDFVSSEQVGTRGQVSIIDDKCCFQPD